MRAKLVGVLVVSLAAPWTCIQTDTVATQDPDADWGGSGGDAEQVPYCQVACDSPPSDCDLGTESNDADNYSCDDGACHYLGCNSDAECQSMGDYLCRDQWGVTYCLPACDSPSDCVVGAAAFDEDNYSCDDGACHYLGCNSDAECQNMGNYLCRSSGVIYQCVHTCYSAGDCDLGFADFDADNYSCDGGLCHYLGCNSDAECQTVGYDICR